MKKILALMLAVLLTQTLFVNQTFAGTKEEKFTGKVKTEIAKLGTGTDAKIKVKLKDGTKIKGYVMEAGEDQFVVMNTKTGQAVPVAYPQVGQVKGNNLSSGVAIAIGVAAAIIFLIILGSSLK
ncbi:hypothetical protein BH20ACI4_BH20ACI4_23930 [soil metagenome]